MSRGRLYSLLMGITFVPFIVLAMLFLRGQIAWFPVAGFAIGAMIAARLGGWLALLCGDRDYGGRACAFTFIAYLFLSGVIAQLLYGMAHPDRDLIRAAHAAGALTFIWDFAKDSFAASLYISMVYGWLVFIACVAGILMFRGLLARAHRLQAD